MSDIRLVRMTRVERTAFADAQIEDYAAWLLGRTDEMTPAAAQAQARTEIERELAAAVDADDLLWAALDHDARTVGWLWVKRGQPGLPKDAAFLYQIQVVVGLQRRGYGQAMLAALETELANHAFRELRLNVWDTNTPAKHLYAKAGFTLVETLESKRQLRKVFATPQDPPS